IQKVIEKFGGLKGIANVVVGSMIAAAKTIVDNWSKIPAAIGDIVLSTVNTVIRATQQLINKSIGLINSFTGLVNKILPENFEIPSISEVSFNGVKNDYEGKAAEIGKAFNDTLDA